MKLGHWNDKENCRQEALKFSTRMEFKKRSFNAYTLSSQFGWLDDICTHMKVFKRVDVNGCWGDIEKCRVEALKYNTKCEFHQYSRVAYLSSRKHNWINEICAHMDEYNGGTSINVPIYFVTLNNICFIICVCIIDILQCIVYSFSYLIV